MVTTHGTELEVVFADHLFETAPSLRSYFEREASQGDYPAGALHSASGAIQADKDRAKAAKSGADGREAPTSPFRTSTGSGGASNVIYTRDGNRVPAVSCHVRDMIDPLVASVDDLGSERIREQLRVWFVCV